MMVVITHEMNSDMSNNDSRIYLSHYSYVHGSQRPFSLRRSVNIFMNKIEMLL